MDEDSDIARCLKSLFITANKQPEEHHYLL